MVVVVVVVVVPTSGGRGPQSKVLWTSSTGGAKETKLPANADKGNTTAKDAYSALKKCMYFCGQRNIMP